MTATTPEAISDLQSTTPDYDGVGMHTTFHIDELSDTELHELRCFDYEDLAAFGLGSVSDEVSEGLLLQYEEEVRAIFVMGKGGLHRFTVSGTSTYGFEVAHTDTLASGESYQIGNQSRLTHFAYNRRGIDRYETDQYGVYLQALERCGYGALQSPTSPPMPSGWLRSLFGLSK
ncbi:MAG: hypothetical protein JWM00_290 [Candidatus Saccharibacteria bacterium]|nr:hypothetical protein [Candidatus Saccharibacteria bacterium]